MQMYGISGALHAMGYQKKRLQEDLRKKIALVIKERIRDPRVPELVSVTDIVLSADTRHATVYLSIFGEEAYRQEALAVLNKAAAFVQHEVSAGIRNKYMPQLLFKLDSAIDKTTRIDSLLDALHDDLE